MSTNTDRSAGGNPDRVAFLGLGIMGSGMAGSLLRAGLDVTVWNRSPEPAQALGAKGATVASSAGEAVAGAGIVVTMLSDGDATASVVGPLLDSPAPDTLWIQMGTIGLAATAELSARAVASGVGFVDAPVSGTKQPAEEGKLGVIAAGPAAIRDRCTPVFDAVGQKTTWVSETPGDAMKLKLVVNGFLASTLAGAAESLSLTAALGLDPALFLEFIDGGPLSSPGVQMRGKAMVERTFPTSFSLAMARKDLGLIADAATTAGLDLPVAGAVAGLFDRAVAAGHGDEDIAAVITGLD